MDINSKSCLFCLLLDFEDSKSSALDLSLPLPFLLEVVESFPFFFLPEELLESSCSVDIERLGLEVLIDANFAATILAS